jgi:[protein-PII] uridylyltransferase
VVIRFARRIGDQERLDNLYLLTVADMRGTSPKVWNSWKGRLLFQLYVSTSRVLAQGFGNPERLEERAADLKRQAMQQLAKDKVPADPVQSLWQALDDWYFTRYDAGSLAWHAQRITRCSIMDLPMVAARLHPEHEGIEILVFAPLTESLFPTLTGGIDRLGLNIVDARLHSTHTGFALDTFVVLAPNVSRRNEPGLPAKLESELRQQILTPRAGPNPKQESLPRALKQFPIPTRVEFGPSANGQSTMMEVVAQDRPGLLYQVALALKEAKARVQSARVSTFGERAQDTFFITNRDEQPFDDPVRQQKLHEDIVLRLGNGEVENIVTPETQVLHF